jgi:hypothetical protein
MHQPLKLLAPIDLILGRHAAESRPFGDVCYRIFAECFNLLCSLTTIVDSERAS